MRASPQTTAAMPGVRWAGDIICAVSGDRYRNHPSDKQCRLTTEWQTAIPRQAGSGGGGGGGGGAAAAAELFMQNRCAHKGPYAAAAAAERTLGSHKGLCLARCAAQHPGPCPPGDRTGQQWWPASDCPLCPASNITTAPPSPPHTDTSNDQRS